VPAPDPIPALEAAFLGVVAATSEVASAGAANREAAELFPIDDDLLPRTHQRRRDRRG
jgi:hypothetical protein